MQIKQLLPEKDMFFLCCLLNWLCSITSCLKILGPRPWQKRSRFILMGMVLLNYSFPRFFFFSKKETKIFVAKNLHSPACRFQSFLWASFIIFDQWWRSWYKYNICLYFHAHPHVQFQKSCCNLYKFNVTWNKVIEDD